MARSDLLKDRMHILHWNGFWPEMSSFSQLFFIRERERQRQTEKVTETETVMRSDLLKERMHILN